MKKKVIELGSKTIKTLTKVYPHLRVFGKIIEKIAPHIHHTSDILLTKRKKRQRKKLISQKTNIIPKIKINKKMKKKVRTRFKIESSQRILKEIMAGVGTTAVSRGLLGSGLLSSLISIGGSYLIGKWNSVIGAIVGLILPSGEGEERLFNVPYLHGMMSSMPCPVSQEEGKVRYYSRTTGKIIDFE